MTAFRNPIQATNSLPGRILVGRVRIEQGKGMCDSFHRDFGTEDWLLLIGVTGRGHIELRAEAFEIRPGDVYLYLPRVEHHHGLRPGAKHWEMFFAHFVPKAGWFSLLKWQEATGGLRHIHLGNLTERSRVEHAFDECIACAGSKDRHRELLVTNALEKILLLLDRQFHQSHWPDIDERLRGLLFAVKEHIERKWTLEELAAQAGLSVPRIVQLFRAQIGVSPRRYVEQCRMQRAAERLQASDLPISQISYEVGFENPFYFSTRFKQCMHVSPSEYRAHFGRSRK